MTGCARWTPTGSSPTSRESPAGVPGGWGNTGDGGPATAALLNLGGNTANQVAVGPDGSVHIADTNNQRIRVVDPTGVISEFAGVFGTQGIGGDDGPATAATFLAPSALFVDALGNVFIADPYTYEVREVFVPGPTIVSPATAGLTVGVAGSFSVVTRGVPAPAVAEHGALPAVLSFNPTTRDLQRDAGKWIGQQLPRHADGGQRGDPQRDSGLHACRRPGHAHLPDQRPEGRQHHRTVHLGGDPEAQGYQLTIGTMPTGTDLFNSGVLPATTTSSYVPALPSGTTLCATLVTDLAGGTTSDQVVSFIAAPGEATFSHPINGLSGTDPTLPSYGPRSRGRRATW